MKRRSADPHKPAVPVVYALFALSVVAERGVGRDQLLAGTGISPAVLENPETRLSVAQYGRLIGKALDLTGDPGLGYELGLRSQLTKHGFLGYGLMSCATLREAIGLLIRYQRARIPFFDMRLFTDTRHAIIEVQEALAFGGLRRFGFDAFLVELGTLLGSLLGVPFPGLELWFDYPQPQDYRRARHYFRRLPKLRFSRVANQLRFPQEILDRKLATANPVTARLMIQECERELSLLGRTGDFLGQVRALLVIQPGGYPDPAAVSIRLNMSGRSLKRKLRQHGTSYRELLGQARLRDSKFLLENLALPVAEIATRVGYSDPANFTRAFCQWSGVPPSTYRARSSH
ncbi:MAG: AraC family transcriptional regulator [Burkholderiales bacterium]